MFGIGAWIRKRWIAKLQKLAVKMAGDRIGRVKSKYSNLPIDESKLSATLIDESGRVRDFTKPSILKDRFSRAKVTLFSGFITSSVTIFIIYMLVPNTSLSAFVPGWVAACNAAAVLSWTAYDSARRRIKGGIREKAKRYRKTLAEEKLDAEKNLECSDAVITAKLKDGAKMEIRVAHLTISVPKEAVVKYIPPSPTLCPAPANDEEHKVPLLSIKCTP